MLLNPAATSFITSRSRALRPSTGFRDATPPADAAVAIGELYGVDVVGRLLRSRNAGRAIVREAERRQSEIIVLGAPRAERPGRTIFSETVDYVLKNAPCRVMVAAGRKVAA